MYMYTHRGLRDAKLNGHYPIITLNSRLQDRDFCLVNLHACCLGCSNRLRATTEPFAQGAGIESPKGCGGKKGNIAGDLGKGRSRDPYICLGFRVPVNPKP